MKNRLKLIIGIICLLSCNFILKAKDYQPQFSTANFYALSNTPREVFSMNVGWKFYKGDVKDAYKYDFNDTTWKDVNLPDGIEILPAEASGCVNYQGIVWYRKHFTINKNLEGKRLYLYFEGIMGKSKIWLNGKLITEHFGGYLPIVIDVDKDINFDKENIIAVEADNSNDPMYPPGKPQENLDFTYCGGIYRDCYLVATNRVYITDANQENKVAGGGMFVSYGKISDKLAEINLKCDIKNTENNTFRGKIEYQLIDKNNKVVLTKTQSVKIDKNTDKEFSTKVNLKNPNLWSPDSPYLYRLNIYIKHGNKIVDGYQLKIGIRSIEFKGKDGVWINGKPYNEPLMGANRHQDYAVVGNALSNSLHWRDAKKLRDLGLKVIRNAHYPQDPAFMDACDELGLFVIINTPGWQFWNKAPIFAQRVFSDIKNMVRRDRNRPCLFFWEPILNETWYNKDFVKNAIKIIKDEYPYPYNYYACDSFAAGNKDFPILYRHPPLGGGSDVKEDSDYRENTNYYTREWGDNVDDWNSHNSPSRVSRSWGEVPMLIQARNYAKPPFQYTCYDVFYQVPKQHFGGCLWHPFDHQRGYHPDPFYGGLMDNFRQPKYSYYMFKAQRPAVIDTNLISETGPMVYIANILSPFSPQDVTIYSNCDKVVLQFCKDGKEYVYNKDKNRKGMPSPVITFKNVTDVMMDKKYSRSKKQRDYYLLAKGYMDDKLVATDTVYPARRPTKLVLSADNCGNKLIANGSDLMTIVASVVDKWGTVKRLNNENIVFEIEGPAKLVCDKKSQTNPVRVQWGTAPILIRSTTKPGKIRIKAHCLWQGSQVPIEGELIIESIPDPLKEIADSTIVKRMESKLKPFNDGHQKKSQVDTTDESKLKEVEKQQADFENNN